MQEEKPAEMCLSKKMNKLDAASVNGCRKKHPSALQFLCAVMGFVANFGRVLKFVDNVIEWWENLN